VVSRLRKATPCQGGQISEGQEQGTAVYAPAAVNSMKDVSAKILISDVFLDESIYPRENIDHKRVGIFVENLRDG